MIDEMGMVATREGPISVADLLLLSITYLSSKFILCSDIFNSYNPRDSENKLAVPLP